MDDDMGGMGDGGTDGAPDWGTPDDDMGFDEPGTDLEPIDTIDAEIVDEPAEDDELIGDGRWVEGEWTSTEVEPWKVSDDPADSGWGQPEGFGEPAKEEPRQGPNDGVRPSGGNGGGGGGGSGGKKSWRPRKPKGATGGNGGGGGGGGIHLSLLGGLFNNASLVKTGAIGSGNALVKGRTGSGHTAGGIVHGTGRRPPSGKRR